jgi:hypothetical protein
VSHSRAPEVLYTPLEKFGWEDAGDGVTVLILDGMRGVGALPKGAVVADFTEHAFDVRIHGLDGKNFRLRQTNLVRGHELQSLTRVQNGGGPSRYVNRAECRHAPVRSCLHACSTRKSSPSRAEWR